jgi:hypothetical protein
MQKQLLSEEAGQIRGSDRDSDAQSLLEMAEMEMAASDPAE